MSILEIGKKKNITQTALNLAKSHFENETKPLIITNKDLPIIEESAYIINALEEAGYEVNTFVTGSGYGIEVIK